MEFTTKLKDQFSESLLNAAREILQPKKVEQPKEEITKVIETKTFEKNNKNDVMASAKRLIEKYKGK